MLAMKEQKYFIMRNNSKLIVILLYVAVYLATSTKVAVVSKSYCLCNKFF